MSDVQNHQTPDEIRADIEATRRRLGGDVDAVAEKVSPSSFAQRQTDRVRAGFKNMTDSIMGTDDEPGVTDAARDAARDAGHAVGDAAREAPRQVVRQTRGNPVVAGAIAFGVGLLIASLIPSSRVERDAATTVKDKAQPLVDEAQSIGKSMAEDLKQPAQDAVDSVRSTAEQGVAHVRDDAQAAGEQVRGRAEDARDRVQDQAQHGNDGHASQQDGNAGRSY